MWTYKLLDNKIVFEGFFDLYFDAVDENQVERATFYAEKLTLILNEKWDEKFNSYVLDEYLRALKNSRLKALSKIENIATLDKLTATDVVFEDKSGTKRKYKWLDNDWVEQP